MISKVPNLLLEPSLGPSPWSVLQGSAVALLAAVGEAWTRRDIYIQSDRLPAIVRRSALMSAPLLPVQKGERHQMTMGSKQDKEEMFKFRPLLTTIFPPLSVVARATWRSSSFSFFVNSFSFPPVRPLPIVPFQWKDFHIQRQIPKEDQPVRPGFSQSLCAVYTNEKCLPK